MTGKTVTAVAQWALYGAETSHDEGRVLACSTGELGRSNFHELIRRFDPGKPDDRLRLPQITMSYLTTASQGESLLAMAVHGCRQNEDGEGAEGDVSAVTSYFCLPYRRLADAAVSYQGMHQALGAIQLPTGNGPPLAVTMTGSGPGTPAVDDLALQAAARLITGRPVCVLGAADVPLAARLAFIDTVMSLLPYGLRAKMTAATWTAAGYPDHRFRLYFSDTERAADPPDHVLRWGQPGLHGPIDDHAQHYLDWLDDAVSQPIAKLAELTDPVRFTRTSILQMLDAIGVVSQDDPAQNYSVTGQDWLHPAPAPPTGSELVAGEPVLRACAEHVRAGDQQAVRADIGVLMRMTGIEDHERVHYRGIIKETGLLSQTEMLGRIAGRLYEQLLRVAFTLPLSYEGFCQVEDCLGQAPISPALWQEIETADLADPWVTSIVYWSLRKDGRRLRKESGKQRLHRWYNSGQLDAVEFVERLAGPWEHPAHARIICEVTLDFLMRHPKGYRPDTLRAALLEHGFLAAALQRNQVGNATFRAQALRRFLNAAYPSGLDQEAVVQILAGRTAAPTPPLLAAVLLSLTKLAQEPATRLAWRAYLRGSIKAMDLDDQTRGLVTQRLPPLTSRRSAADRR